MSSPRGIETLGWLDTNDVYALQATIRKLVESGKERDAITFHKDYDEIHYMWVAVNRVAVGGLIDWGGNVGCDPFARHFITSGPGKPKLTVKSLANASTKDEAALSILEDIADHGFYREEG